MLKRNRLALDAHLCQYNFPGCTITATTVDLVEGGDHSRASIHDCLSACLQCHGHKDGGRRY